MRARAERNATVPGRSGGIGEKVFRIIQRVCGIWAAAGGSRPRSLARLRVVPEARKKLAGGEAQRNHRKNRTKKPCAPAGRESRETPPSRPVVAIRNLWPSFRPACNPVGVLRPGVNARRKHRGGRSWRSVFTALAPRRGAASVGGGGPGGSAALHHRLISCVPPARRGGAVKRAERNRTKASQLQCARSPVAARARRARVRGTFLRRGEVNGAAPEDGRIPGRCGFAVRSLQLDDAHGAGLDGQFHAVVAHGEAVGGQQPIVRGSHGDA